MLKDKKVAFCFRGAMDKIKSGHYSRSHCDIYKDLPYVPFELVKVSIQKHIIDANPDYEFDFFIHSWNSDLESKFTELYNPKASCYENNSVYEEDIKKNIVHNFAYTSQQLSICKSIEIMENYSIKNNIVYDYIISYRPDALLYKDMILEKYNIDNVYVNSNVYEDFHFVMGYNDSLLFKQLYGKKMLFQNFVNRVMKKTLLADDIKCGLNQEILRKIKISVVDKGYHNNEFFYKYGLCDDLIQYLTHI
jgi:hypothetical protein